MLRAGYGWQENITSDDFRTQYWGTTAGLTIQLPISENGTRLALDYAYAPTRVFSGIHNLSLRLLIGSKKS